MIRTLAIVLGGLMLSAAQTEEPSAQNTSASNSLSAICVLWTDAVSLGAGWQTREDLEAQAGPLLVISCGHLVREDEAGVTLALDMSEAGMYNQAGYIPQCLIVDRLSISLEKFLR